MKIRKIAVVFVAAALLASLLAVPALAAQEWGTAMVISDLSPDNRWGSFVVKAQAGVDYSKAEWVVLEVLFDGIDWDGEWYGFAGCVSDSADDVKFGGADFEKYGGADDPLVGSYSFNLKVDGPMTVADDGVLMNVKLWWAGINSDFTVNVTGKEKITMKVSVLDANRRELVAAGGSDGGATAPNPSPATGDNGLILVALGSLLSAAVVAFVVLKKKPE